MIYQKSFSMLYSGDNTNTGYFFLQKDAFAKILIF